MFEFDEWAEAVEETGGREEDRVEQLKVWLAETDQLLDHLSAARTDFLNLKVAYEESQKKTIEVHELTESVRQEQYTLLVAREKISETMSHFEELDRMCSQFANPSHLILNESLVAKLSRLDECIAFMRTKASYQESRLPAEVFIL